MLLRAHLNLGGPFLIRFTLGLSNDIRDAIHEIERFTEIVRTYYNEWAPGWRNWQTHGT
jgi:hypothetical protein